jgi:hypothetical protein
MRHGHPEVSLIERFLARAARAGFTVETVAISPTGEARVGGYDLTLRFGDPALGAEATTLHVEIELSGDSRTGELRRWRISRLLEEQGDCPPLRIEAVLDLSGDVGIDFIGSQAREGHRMLQDLLEEIKASLDELPPAEGAASARGPDVFARVRGAGELVVGRSGLVRGDDTVQEMAVKHRKLRVAICDRLSSEILPMLATVGAEVIAEWATRPAAESAAALRKSAGPRDGVVQPALSSIAGVVSTVAGPEGSAHRRNPPSTSVT